MTDMDKMMIEDLVAAEELTARRLLAQRERNLGFTGYADWLDADCPSGTDHEYPHERIADICFYVRAAVSAYNPDDSLSQEVENLTHDLKRQMTIANIECNEVERLREALEAIRQWFKGYAANFPDCDVDEEIALIDKALSPLPQGDT